MPGRSELLVVAQLIASFREEEPERSHYLVEAPNGSRWILVEREMADGPRWVGRAVSGDDER